MLPRVALFALFLILSTVISAPAQIIWDLVSGPGVTDAVVTVDTFFGPLVMAWQQDGQIRSLAMEGDAIFDDMDHGSGEQPELCSTPGGVILAWTDGNYVRVRRRDNWGWNGIETIDGGGLSGANVSLTGWQPGVGYEFQQAYLCWEEQGGGLWFAAWDEGSWTVGFYVRDVGSLGNARPRAVPTMTATGVQPRIYYLDGDTLAYVEGSPTGWTDPAAVAGGHSFGVDFEVEVGPGFSQHVLSLGPPPACPCNIVLYTECPPGGDWLEPEQLTVGVAYFDWPHDPSLGVSETGRVHAFWNQEALDEMMEPVGEGMYYLVREDGVWSEETALLQGHVGIGCDLSMEYGHNATLLWRECDGDFCEIWMLSSALVLGVEGVPGARVDLQVVPNPFNPATTFRFRLPAAATVSLFLHDTTGRRVRTVLEGATFAAGDARVNWDGRDDAGRPVPSGVYLARLETPGQVTTARAVLVK